MSSPSSETPASSLSDEDIIISSSAANLQSLTKCQNTCDIVPTLIELEKQNLRNGSSVLTDDGYTDKSKIYDLVSTIRLVDSKLERIRVKALVNRILIVTKIYDIEPVLDTLKLIKHILTINPKSELHIQDDLMKIQEFDLAGIASENPELRVNERVQFWSANRCTYNPNTFDLIITLGGDGTILFASWLFQELIPPLLSFSLGLLGFLTQFDFSEYVEVLDDVIQNGYQCLIRTRFQCTVMKSEHNRRQRVKKNELFYDAGKVLNEAIRRKSLSLEGSITTPRVSLSATPNLEDELASGEMKTHYKMLTYSIFNDIVIDRGPNSTMTSIDLFSDTELITNVEADGCVISTPSGSTAYSLSAGGSLVHPDIPGILISPICPHSLSFRPLIVPESTILRAGVPYDSRTSAWCSFDGKNRVELEPGDFLTITTSQYPLPFVKNTKCRNEWFRRLSDTLHWNERKRQKKYNNLVVHEENI